MSTDASIITTVDDKKAWRVVEVTGLITHPNEASYVVEVDGKKALAIANIAGAEIIKVTEVNDENHTVNFNEYKIHFTALTTTRTVILPVSDGETRRFSIKDGSGNASPTEQIRLLIFNGGQTIDDVDPDVVEVSITAPYASIDVYNTADGKYWTE